MRVKFVPLVRTVSTAARLNYIPFPVKDLRIAEQGSGIRQPLIANFVVYIQVHGLSHEDLIGK